MSGAGAKLPLVLPSLVCAAALVGCGSGGGAQAVPATPASHVVTLQLRGESGHEELLACSLVHRYATFSARGRIAYAGSVRPAPAGRWKVKVKIKRCVDGRFQDSGADRIFGTPDGNYSGYLRPPGVGVYFARVRYRAASGDILSDKSYFEVR